MIKLRIFAKESILPLHGSQSCCGKGACVSQKNYEPCCAGPPKTDRSWLSVLTIRGPRLVEMAIHSGILCWKTSWTAWKGFRYEAGGWAPQVGRCPVCYWGKAEGITNTHYSCWENSMDKGVWRATVHGVTMSQTWLSTPYTHTHKHTCMYTCTHLISYFLTRGAYIFMEPVTAETCEFSSCIYGNLKLHPT